MVPELADLILERCYVPLRDALEKERSHPYTPEETREFLAAIEVMAGATEGRVKAVLELATHGSEARALASNVTSVLGHVDAVLSLFSRTMPNLPAATEVVARLMQDREKLAHLRDLLETPLAKIDIPTLAGCATGDASFVGLDEVTRRLLHADKK